MDEHSTESENLSRSKNRFVASASFAVVVVGFLLAVITLMPVWRAVSDPTRKAEIGKQWGWWIWHSRDWLYCTVVISLAFTDASRTQLAAVGRVIGLWCLLLVAAMGLNTLMYDSFWSANFTNSTRVGPGIDMRKQNIYEGFRESWAWWISIPVLWCCSCWRNLCLASNCLEIPQPRRGRSITIGNMMMATLFLAIVAAILRWLEWSVSMNLWLQPMKAISVSASILGIGYLTLRNMPLRSRVVIGAALLLVVWCAWVGHDLAFRRMIAGVAIKMPFSSSSGYVILKPVPETFWQQLRSSMASAQTRTCTSTAHAGLAWSVFWLLGHRLTRLPMTNDDSAA